MTDRFYSRMFLLAALWNVFAAVAGLAFYQFQLRLFFGSEAYTDCFYQTLFYRIALTAVLIFGIGYYMVSRQITANRGIVWLGDLVWAILFLTFLFQTRDRNRVQYCKK